MLHSLFPLVVVVTGSALLAWLLIRCCRPTSWFDGICVATLTAASVFALKMALGAPRSSVDVFALLISGLIFIFFPCLLIALIVVVLRTKVASRRNWADKRESGRFGTPCTKTLTKKTPIATFDAINNGTPTPAPTRLGSLVFAFARGGYFAIVMDCYASSLPPPPGGGHYRAIRAWLILDRANQKQSPD